MALMPASMNYDTKNVHNALPSIGSPLASVTQFESKAHVLVKPHDKVGSPNIVVETEVQSTF